MGNVGSCSHQINELSSRKISQNEINAAGHLRGARCGIKILLWSPWGGLKVNLYLSHKDMVVNVSLFQNLIMFESF